MWLLVLPAVSRAPVTSPIGSQTQWKTCRDLLSRHERLAYASTGVTEVALHQPSCPVNPQGQDRTDLVADRPPQVLGGNSIMEIVSSAPGTGSSAQSDPALPVTSFMFALPLGICSNLGSMQLNGDCLNELDLLDENSSLAFHDFVASQFLDKDISLSELLHQSSIPAHLSFMGPEFPAALDGLQSP